MANYKSIYTGAEIDSAIGKANTALQEHQELKTINNESLVGEGNITIEGTSYTAGSNIQISNENVISATDTIYDDTELREIIAEKQEELVSGENIKTINGNSVLGEGNLVIEGGEGSFSYRDIDFTDETQWTGSEPTQAVLQDILDNDYQAVHIINIEGVADAWLWECMGAEAEGTQIKRYVNFDDADESEGTPAMVTFFLISKNDGEEEIDFHSSDIPLNDYSSLNNKPLINSVELSGDKSLSDLGIQSTLVSGTNIKTINNTSLLGEGNISISGGEGGSKPTKNFIHVSMDDTSSTVDYINSASNASIYGNTLLKAMKDMHEEHNMVFSLYLYKNLSFDTSTANGAAKKAELYAARDWLKFGYHKIGGSFCDQLSYADAKTIYTTFANAILTHCGSLDSIDRMPRLDYFRSGKSGLQGFRDAPAGLLGVLGPDDVRTDNIYLPVENQKWLSGYEDRDSSVTTNWYPKDYITDHELGIKYFKTDLRLDWITQTNWSGQNHDKPSGEKTANANAVYQSLMDWYKDGRHSDTFCPMIIFFHEVEWTSGRLTKAYFEKIAQFAEEVGMDFDYPQNRFYDMPNRYDINVGGETPETKELKSIVVLTPPNKTNYEVGETFNTGGMVVAANYETTTTHTPSQEIISTYSYSPVGALSLSDTTITISYNEKTTTQAISVVNPGTISYTITTSVTNGTYSGATEIYDGGTAQVTIVPDSGYDIPTSENITVVGASYTYTNGTVSLSNPTTDVTISATCPEGQIVTDTIANNTVTLVKQLSQIPVAGWTKNIGFSGGTSVRTGAGAVTGRAITVNQAPNGTGYCVDVQGKSRIRITDASLVPFIAGFMLSGKGETDIATNSDTTHANWNKASYWWDSGSDGLVINLQGNEKYWFPYIKMVASPTETITDSELTGVMNSIVIE